MSKTWMWMVAAGCMVAMAAAAEQGAAPEGAPTAPDGGRKGMREHGRAPMMEAREFGEGMIMRALAPDSPIAKEIGLTDDQRKALKGVMDSAVEEMKGLQAKMREAGKKQVEMMGQNTPDEAAILKGVEEIGALRTQIAKVTTKQILAAQKVLTTEQRAELRGMIKSRMAEMREQGQGGKGKMKGAGGKKSPPAPESEPEKGE
jgi:Spy/CpxP family protein refolding chaperone